MIPTGPRQFAHPLWPVYRDGLLVAAFRTLEDATEYEDRLEAEAEVTAATAAEPTPLYGEAADAVTFLAALADGVVPARCAVAVPDATAVDAALALLDGRDQ